MDSHLNMCGFRSYFFLQYSFHTVTLIASEERINEDDIDLEGVINGSDCPGYGGLGGGGEYDWNEVVIFQITL